MNLNVNQMNTTITQKGRKERRREEGKGLPDIARKKKKKTPS